MPLAKYALSMKTPVGIPTEPLSCIHEQHLAELHRRVLEWYRTHARVFFWREQQHNAYIVLVSEVMLQQTQTARVEIKLPKFLEQFPTIYALAAADNAAIVRAWQGMGYNNRAIRLRDCARALVERHSGRIPETLDELLALPGIGRYTASAILVFAYGRDMHVVDVNIQRVYSRLLYRMATTADVLSDKEIHELAARSYAPGQSSAWHQALMDIGAVYCTARAPKCSACPVADTCCSAFSMAEVQRVKKPEPSWRGEPNRIWRGRVVELLRSCKPGHWLATTDVLAHLWPGELFTEEDAARTWLHAIAESLQRDRIVELRSADGVPCAALRLAQEDDRNESKQ